MAAPVIQKAYIQDINRPIEVRHGGGLMFTGDANADRISVALYDCQTPFALSGSVTGTCIRNDGQTVVLTGGILGGNTAYVVLAQSCFVVPGPLAVTIRVSAGGVSTTVLKAVYTIDQTTTEEIVDPGHVVPDISDIVAEYARMQAASDAAEAAAENANEAAQFATDDEWTNGDTLNTGRVYQTLRQANFELKTQGAILEVISGDVTHAQIDAQSGWSVYEYEFPHRMRFRLETVDKNTPTVSGVLPMAARLGTGSGAVYYSIDSDRVGGWFVADALLVNYSDTLEASAIKSVSIMATACADFEDVIVCHEHAGEFDKIVAFGDSIFAGYNVGANEGIIARLGALMGLPVVNNAVSNATLSTATPRPNPDAGSVVAQVQAYATPASGQQGRPLYIINGGTNDQYHYQLTNIGQYTDGVNGITSSIYGATYAIINALLLYGADPWQIVITTPIPKDIRNSTAEHLAELDAQLTAIGQTMYEIGIVQGVNVINGYHSVFDNLEDANAKTIIMPDNTHPSKYGAALYAERIYGLVGGANQREVTELKSAATQTTEQAIVTADINTSRTYNGVTFDRVDDNTLKAYGTAESARRFLCLNGQREIATSGTAFSKTLDAGVYEIETAISGYLEQNVSWQYTYTTFANSNIIVTKTDPKAKIKFENPVMFGFAMASGTDFGTANDPTFITISAKKTSGYDETARNDIARLDNAVIACLTGDNNAATTIAAGADLNNYTTPGNYKILSSAAAQQITHRASDNAGRLFVLRPYNDTRVVQFWLDTGNAPMLYRKYTTTWSTWDRVVTGESYDATGMQIRGSVTGLGYTTIGACTAPGAYTFSSDDASSITDLPSNWPQSGGVALTYNNNGTAWQEIKCLTASYIRYSFNGTWFNTTQNAINNAMNSAVAMRGGVLGMGTSFAECTLPGAYTFTTGDLNTITDEPSGLSAGGLLLTYVNGDRVWQEIHSTFETFIRYGFTGAWQRQRETLAVAYNAGAGADSSVAQITVDIPKDTTGRKIRYEMGHCVDNAVNGDVWRLMFIYYVLSNGNATVMTRRGEFECALHLKDRSDFSGGIVHGDEIDQNVTFFVDGRPTAAQNVGGFCNEFRIVRNSLLYDPNDSTTVIAEHGCEYIFDKTGLTINQSVKWLVDENLTMCYLAMFPIIKDFSTYRYDNTSFAIVQNPTTPGYDPIAIPGATSVTEYNANVASTMEIPKYPTGLTGGDKALVTDNSKTRPDNPYDYNKVYFYVCNGGTSQNGELWQSTTKYVIK